MVPQGMLVGLCSAATGECSVTVGAGSVWELRKRTPHRQAGMRKSSLIAAGCRRFLGSRLLKVQLFR